LEVKMADETFGENLMRTVVAELHFMNCVTGAREMFGRGYFSLGETEKAALHQVVLGSVAANYQAITREWLAGHVQQQPVGFIHPAPTGTQSK
jgi:hypothetical protein